MTNQNDDERAAREWLKEAGQIDDFYGVNEDTKHRATILRLLDRPVCPRGADVPDDVLRAMGEALAIYGDDDVVSEMRAAIDILHAHLTAPPLAKKVEAWAVILATGEQFVFNTEERAHINARSPGSRIIKLIEAADADQ